MTGTRLVQAAKRPDRALERLDAMPELAMPELLTARRKRRPWQPLDGDAVGIARPRRRQIGRSRQRWRQSRGSGIDHLRLLACICRGLRLLAAFALFPLAP